MIDSRLVGTAFNEPTLWTGRWTGAGNVVPVAVAYTSKKVNIARTGVGALTITLSDPTTGNTGNGLTGVVQTACAWINSGLIGGANLKDATISPIAANTAAFTVQVQYRNGTAVDLTSSEELHFECWTSRSAQP